MAASALTLEKNLEVLIDANNCRVRFCKDFYTEKESIQLFKQLQEELIFKPEVVTCYGKTHVLSRQTCSHGDKELKYRYSGKTEIAIEWTPTLLSIKNDLESFLGNNVAFNFVLCNYYPNGKTKLGIHFFFQSNILRMAQ